MLRPLLTVVSAALVVGGAPAQEKSLVGSVEPDRIVVRRKGGTEPLVAHVVKPDFRPYLHPIAAPTGPGVLTEFSPGHHKHQTGLYVGHTRLNGKDYFHNPGNGYFTRTKLEPPRIEGSRARWSVTYDLNGAAGPVLTETQTWSLHDRGGDLILDLVWTGTARTDVTVGKYDYGGVFLRMPFKGAGKAVTSEGLDEKSAEGKRARWIDVGLPIEGRAQGDWGHIAVLDHPKNPGHPSPWRVDGQLGISPVRARLGDWSIANGQTAEARHRFVVYTGPVDVSRVEKAWTELSKP